MTVPDVAVAELGDGALMLRVQADDPDAFSALYDRFCVRGYRVAYALVGDPAIAEDAVQEAFLSIWRSRAAYAASRGTVVAWVMSAVRHRAIDLIRKNSRHAARRVDAEASDVHVQAPGDLVDTVAERDQAAHLRGALGRLPEAQRHVIALAYFGELSVSEIASELSLPLGTVKGRMRLGLQKLRDDQVTKAA